MSTLGVTLNRHILDEGHKHPGAVGELSRLLVQIGLRQKFWRGRSHGPLVGGLDLAGEKTATGDA